MIKKITFEMVRNGKMKVDVYKRILFIATLFASATAVVTASPAATTSFHNPIHFPLNELLMMQIFNCFNFGFVE